jgi:hypothetical protein
MRKEYYKKHPSSVLEEKLTTKAKKDTANPALPPSVRVCG